MDCRSQCQVHPGGRRQSARSRKVLQEQHERPIFKEQEFFYEYPTNEPSQQTYYEGASGVKQQPLYQAPASVRQHSFINRQGDIKAKHKYTEQSVVSRQQQSPVGAASHQPYYDDLPVSVKQRTRFDGIPTGMSDTHEPTSRRPRSRREKPSPAYVNRDRNSITEIPVATNQVASDNYPVITEHNGSYIIKMGPATPGAREDTPSIILSPESNGIWVNVTNSQMLTTNTVMRRSKRGTRPSYSWDTKGEPTSPSSVQYQQLRESTSQYPVQYQLAPESSSTMPFQYQQVAEPSPTMPTQYEQVADTSSAMPGQYQQVEEPSTSWPVQYQEVAAASPAMTVQNTQETAETYPQYSAQYQSTPSLNYPNQEHYTQYCAPYPVADPSPKRIHQYQRRTEPSPRRPFSYQLPGESGVDYAGHYQFDGTSWCTDANSSNNQQGVGLRKPQTAPQSRHGQRR